MSVFQSARIRKQWTDVTMVTVHGLFSPCCFYLSLSPPPLHPSLSLSLSLSCTQDSVLTILTLCIHVMVFVSASDVMYVSLFIFYFHSLLPLHFSLYLFRPFSISLALPLYHLIVSSMSCNPIFTSWYIAFYQLYFVIDICIIFIQY